MLTAVILFNLALGIAINLPKLRKPLSEDDGHWFYGAVFRSCRYFYHRDSDPLRNLHCQGYFGIHLLARWFTGLFPGDPLKAVRWFRIVWFAASAAMVSWAAWSLWRDPWLALASGLFYNLFMGLSHLTASDLTYAEFYLALPMSGALVALGFGGPWGWLVAGILAGWAVQIKVIALPLSLMLPLPLVWLMGIPQSAIQGLLYLSGITAINLLPALVIALSGTERKAHEVKAYFQAAFGPVLTALRLTVGDASRPADAYTAVKRKNEAGDWRRQWNTVRGRFTVDWAPLRFAFLTALFPLLIPEPFTLLLYGLVLVYFGLLYVQGGYYPPKFGFMWFLAALLAARGTVGVLRLTSFHISLEIAWLFILLLFAIRCLSMIRREVREADDLAGLPPVSQRLFRTAETIGAYLRDLGQPGDRLLIWGNFASICLYSGMEAANPSHMFLYPNRILAEQPVRRTFRDFPPPRWIAMFNYHTRDGWSAERIREEFSLPYDVQRVFQITDERNQAATIVGGIPAVFPVLKLNEQIYKEMLIDRALRSPEHSESLLREALDWTPQDPEVTLRLDPRAETASNPDGDYLLRKLAGLELYAGGQVDEAAEILSGLLWERRDDFRVLLALGEIEFLRGNLRGAFQSLQKTVELNPFSAEAFNDLGVILNELGEPVQARRCLERALRLYPGYPDAIGNLQNLEPTR
jgi:hypothetical protein